MSKKDNEDFNNSAKCCVCKKTHNEVEMKVKGHDFWSWSWNFNTNLSLSKKVLAIFQETVR